MPPALCYPPRGCDTPLSPGGTGGTPCPITGQSAPHPLPAALPQPGGLFAISAGAACGRALRQTSGLKREGRRRAEPEPGKPSPGERLPRPRRPGPQRR